LWLFPMAIGYGYYLWLLVISYWLLLVVISYGYWLWLLATNYGYLHNGLLWLQLVAMDKGIGYCLLHYWLSITHIAYWLF
jgi:hypothetical protein